MKIYFHQIIVEFLCKYLPDLFDRYFEDYIDAIVHKTRRETYKPDSKCCDAFIKKEKDKK